MESEFYDEYDKGLFRIIHSDGSDKFARIASIQLLTGPEIPYHLICYRVYTTPLKPSTADEYAATETYKDPFTRWTMFSFKIKGEPATLDQIEHHCIIDFLNRIKSSDQSKLGWIVPEKAVFRAEEALNVTVRDMEQLVAVDSLRFRLEARSFEGLPVIVSSSKLVYRGYDIDPTNPTRYVSGQNYTRDEYIE